MQGPISDKYKRIILFILLLGSILVFFPGSYSVDTWDMYAAANANKYEDWHSIFMPYLWHLLLFCTHKYYSIYIIQMLIYWFFWELVLVRVFKTNLAFVIGLPFAVIMLSVPQYIMKDAEFFMSWGIGVMFMVISTNEPKNKWKWLIAIVCFFFLAYGYLLRPNNVLAFLPLIYMYAEVYVFKTSTWKKIIFASVVIGLLFFGYFYFTYKVLHANKTYPQYKLQLLDIVGISKKTGQNYIPINITSYKYFDRNKLMAAYCPASIDDIYWPGPGENSVFPRPDSLLNNCVHYYWEKAIMQHPIVYMENRYQGFLYYLKINKHYKFYYNLGVWTDPNNPFHTRSIDNVIVRRFLNLYRYLDRTPFYDPWLWLCLNFVQCLFFFILYRRNNADHALKVLTIMCLSGVLYIIGQFPVYQSDRDFRYTYWNVFITLIGVVYIFDNFRIKKTN